MAQPQHTPSLAHLEEALTVLFCLIDDAYAHLNPHGARHYESIKRLSDSEVSTLALFQQLWGVESERSFLRDAQRFFSHLFPGVVGLHPSSFNRRVKKLRRYLEPLRREILSELIGEPETLLVDSTLLEVLHPRQVSRSAGFAGAAWVRWGSFNVYGVKLHLPCATNRVPLSYELTSANIADISLTEELLAEAALGEGVARRLLGDLAYRSEDLRQTLAEIGILLATERAERRRGARQHI
jgi:DDE family transposase